MNKVNISDLARLLDDKKVLGQMEAELFIRKMFDVLNEGLDNDKLVKVKWLGTFKVQAVKDRESVDVNTGDRIVIEGRDKISFAPDSILKEIVNKPFAQFETVVVNDGVDFDDIDKRFEQMEEEDCADASDENKVSKPVEQSVTLMAEKNIMTKEVHEIEPITTDSASIEKIDSESTIVENIEKEYTAKENTEEESAISIKKVAESEAPQNVDSEPANVDEMEHEAGEPDASTPEVIEGQIAEPITLQSENFNRHHFVLPRYVVVLTILIIVVLISGIGYFAFNFGKMQAQRDELALQLKQNHVPGTVVSKSVVSKQSVSSQEEILRKKALEDSARLAKESEAIKVAEEASERVDKQTVKSKDNLSSNKKTEEKSTNDKNSSASNKNADDVASDKDKYDKDPRVRTGAYRIIGVQQVVTAKAGQTLTVLSNRYLGPGMECYLEALNGSSPLKEGQKIKIPKLELKKKK